MSEHKYKTYIVKNKSTGIDFKMPAMVKHKHEGLDTPTKIDYIYFHVGEGVYEHDPDGEYAEALYVSDQGGYELIVGSHVFPDMKIAQACWGSVINMGFVRDYEMENKLPNNNTTS